MGLKKAIDNLKLDARMLDIHVKAQTLSREDIQKHLDKLPDLAANAQPVDIEVDDDESFLNGEDHN